MNTTGTNLILLYVPGRQQWSKQISNFIIINTDVRKRMQNSSTDGLGATDMEIFLDWVCGVRYAPEACSERSGGAEQSTSNCPATLILSESSESLHSLLYHFMLITLSLDLMSIAVYNTCYVYLALQKYITRGNCDMLQRCWCYSRVFFSCVLTCRLCSRRPISLQL